MATRTSKITKRPAPNAETTADTRKEAAGLNSRRSRDVVAAGLARGGTRKVVVEGKPLDEMTDAERDQAPLAHVQKTIQENAAKVHETKPRRVVEEKATPQGTNEPPKKGTAAADSKRTVKAFQRGFYAGQRIRVGQAFVLEKAEDFSAKWMIHVEPGTPDDVPEHHPKLSTDVNGTITGKTGYADADLSVLGPPGRVKTS